MSGNAIMRVESPRVLSSATAINPVHAPDLGCGPHQPALACAGRLGAWISGTPGGVCQISRRFVRSHVTRAKTGREAGERAALRSGQARSGVRASMNLWCCGCQTDVDARLTGGAEVYSHRPDLAELPFWKCDACGNHVGCHHKTSQPTRPLGNIPTAELRKARGHIHAILDPLWKSGQMPRGKIYAALTKRIGRQYHTGEIRTINEARDVWRAVKEIAAGVPTP